MTHQINPTRAALGGVALLTLSACASGTGQPWDFDMRGRLGAGLETSTAVQRLMADRPDPDSRGIISYPGYQVAVAKPGDDVRRLAGRVGLPPSELASYNGLPIEADLRRGEIVALPRRVSEPSPATGARASGPIRPAASGPAAGATIQPGAVRTASLDVGTVAGNAIARAEQSGTGNASAAPAPAANAPAANAPAEGQSAKVSGEEPQRHRVEKGETAFSISRRYGVPVQALVEWNGLGPDFKIRTGQFLLIPVDAPDTRQAALPAGQSSAPPAAPAVAKPGSGTQAPVPPSAAKPLPERNETQQAAKETPPSPQLGQQQAASNARMAFPVQGPVIRAFQKRKNDGIDIAADAGTPVKAADAGVVAAITRDTDQVPIIVLRHEGNILTVYAGVADPAVSKGDRIARGQTIAKVRAGNPSSLHFEVREGFDSVDPMPYLQ